MQRRSITRLFLSVASVVGALTVAAPSASAKGLDATRISLPKGPGSVEGLGKNFSPSLASGTASYGVDIAVPPAAAGFAPKLSLDYDSGGGISDLGIGWSLGGMAEIRRRTENGLPQFDASDAFEIAGFGAPSDLLEVSPNVFRPQFESGSFVRVQRSADGRTWEARDKSGTTYRFGGDGLVEQEGGNVASWLLREQLDVYGHSIKYAWKTDGSHGRLDRVTYNDFSPEARNEVAFKYEARPDPHTRFTSGIKEEFKDRVTAIEVLHGGALVRRYDLTYKPGLHSQLATVTLVGSDGVTKLPTLSLGYTEPQLAIDAGGLIAMKTPPGRSPADANVDLADLDGDGLPDLLVTSAGNYRTYLNHDGLSWRAPVDWGGSASPSLELAQTGVQLADLDGDGALDLVAKSGLSYFRYFPGKDATSFAAPVAIKTIPNFTFEDPDVRVVDMDGDRRADVVVTTSAGLAIGYNKSGVDWTEPTTIGIVDPAQPLRFSDGKTQLCDVNGDRVQDLCYLRSGSLVYWLGRGRGKFEPAKTATGVPEWDATAPWQLVDLDGDGWLDLLRVGVSNVEFALATGEGTFGAVKVIAGTPTKGLSGIVKLADMNGSGTTDIVWIDVTGSPDTAWRYLELFPQGRGGLLRTIDNGLGKRVTMTYGAASKDAAAARDAGTPWGTRMDTAMPVVKAIEVDAGVGDPILRTEYVYRDGTYSPAERTFAGFGGGTEKSVGDAFTPTLLSDSVFDVGLGDRTLRGALLRVTLRDERGYMLSQTDTTWAARTLAVALDGRKITGAFKSAERIAHVDGKELSAAKVTLTEWEHDEYGSVVAEKKWGEVVGGDKLVGNDEAVTLRTYANNSSDWILGRVASDELQDGHGNRLRLRRVYYDGDPFIGLPLGKVVRGDITREEAWVGPALDQFELVIASRHDADGHEIEIRDARGGGRSYEWDPRCRALLVTESLRTGARELVQHASYDCSEGLLTSFTAYNGAVTTFGYDALGRLTSVVKPGDTAELPTMRYAYELGAPISRVTTEARIFSGNSKVERSASIYDGLGRKRLALVEEAADRWVVSEGKKLDTRGNARRTLLPFFANSGTADPTLLAGDNAGVDAWRDAFGRVVRTRTPLGTETKASFEPLSVKLWDSGQVEASSTFEHTPTTEMRDGLGRLVAVTRILEGKSHRSQFKFDAAGSLVERIDVEGHAARYGYDGRGRRILVDDPDAGKISLVYDPTGNVTERHMPDGSVQRFAFDLLGRTIAEDWDGDGKADVTRAYDEGGDAFLGLLSSTSDPAGGAAYVYDARQRLTSITLSIGSSSYTVGNAFDAQDRKYLHRYPDGSSIRIRYSPRGLVTAYGNDAVTLAYDADGKEVQRSYNTGVVEQFGYDADRRMVESKVSAAGGAILQHLRWVLDSAGNLAELKDLRTGLPDAKDRSESYQYDNFYRLTRVVGRWGEIAWRYSPSGNMLERSGSDPSRRTGVVAYGTGAGPHAPTTFKGRAIRYDARGRMIDDGARKYAFDGLDHLISVTTPDGARQENRFDADGVRRVGVATDSGGKASTTHYIDDWSEVRDGKLIRFIVHGDQRIVRLAENNGAGHAAQASTSLTASSADSEPPATSGGPRSQRAPREPVNACSYFLVVSVLAAAFARHRRAVVRALPGLAFLLVLAAAISFSSVGCKGAGDEPEPDGENGTVLTLGDDDELLFADAIGSLTETTSGAGTPHSSFAAFPHGEARTDGTRETRKFAGTPRDAIGVDLMGARAYAPELGVWISPDPVATFDPEDAHSEVFAALNPYAYANCRPLTHVDRDGRAAIAASPIVLGGAVVIAAGVYIYASTHHQQLGQSLAKAVTPSSSSGGSGGASKPVSSPAPAAAVAVPKTLAPPMTASGVNGKTKCEPNCQLQGHHTIPASLLGVMRDKKLIDQKTYAYLAKYDRPELLYVTRGVHLALHAGLTMHLMIKYPEIAGKMTKGFQKGREWEAYVKVLEDKGFKGAALKDKILSDIGSFYLKTPIIPNGCGGISSPVVSFALDRTRMMK